MITFTTPNGCKVEVEGSVRWIIEVTTGLSGFGVCLSSFGDDYLVVVEDFLKAKDRRSGCGSVDT